MLKRRQRVRAEQAGRVVSVRTGARARVTVEHADGTVRVYISSEAKVKQGKRVRKGAVLGVV